MTFSHSFENIGECNTVYSVEAGNRAFLFFLSGEVNRW